MANTTVKGKFNVVDKSGNVQTIYPKTTGDQVLVDRSSNASVIPNDVANLQHIVNKMGSLALKSKVETSDFTTGTMINSIADLKSNTETGKIADATVVKDIESRVDTLENSNLVTVDELDAGLATKPDTEINDSVTSTSLTWSSKKLSDQLTTLNSNTQLIKSRVDGLSTLQEGSTTGDAELIGIRTGYDSTNYSSAGEAVREQVSELHNSINPLSSELADIRTGANGTIYDSAGNAVRGQFSLYSELRDDTVYTANQISNNTPISGVLDNKYLTVSNIPVTKKGKLIVYVYCRFSIGFESVISAPQKIIVLQKHGTTMTVKAVIPITINTSDADETLGLYQWIKVDTGYHISGRGEYYIAAYNGVTYNIGATSREDFVGYYLLSANVAEGVSVNDTFSANDFRTNSGLLCYPEIDGWNVAMESEVPTKVSELENDLHFTANNNFRSFYWNGKTGNILGDSMTIDNTYTSKLEQMYNMTINNYGVSGTTISTVRDMESHPCFYHRIENMTNECDFVFMLGGTNDWGLGCPLGTIADRTPSTFYGALYYTLNLLRTKYPTKPIFVGTILQRNFVASPSSQPAGIDSNKNGNSVDEFNQAIIYMARRFGCIVIDTWQAGIYPEINGSDYTRDGLHLNITGGQKLAIYIKNVMEQYPVVNTVEV